MATNHPVDFAERAKRPRGAKGTDYPYALSATDLMRNFIYAALDLDESLFEKVSGEKGHLQRRLKIPTLPGKGTFVLGCIDGKMAWIGTEECDNGDN